MRKYIFDKEKVMLQEIGDNPKISNSGDKLMATLIKGRKGRLGSQPINFSDHIPTK